MYRLLIYHSSTQRTALQVFSLAVPQCSSRRRDGNTTTATYRNAAAADYERTFNGSLSRSKMASTLFTLLYVSMNNLLKSISHLYHMQSQEPLDQTYNCIHFYVFSKLYSKCGHYEQWTLYLYKFEEKVNNYSVLNLTSFWSTLTLPPVRV